MLRAEQTFLKKSQKNSKKGLQFGNTFAIITYVAGWHGRHKTKYGSFPEWPMGTDCKSAALCFGGSNPPAPTKKLWQRYCRSFFSLLYRTKSAKAVTDFQSAFYWDVQLLPGGWIFLLPTFSAAFRMLRKYRIILSADTASEVPQPETVEWFMAIL